MLKNNNILPDFADRARLAPIFSENISCNILVKIVNQKANRRAAIHAHGQSEHDHVGEPGTVPKARDEAHCINAAIELIFELMSLRPNHATGRGSNPDMTPDCVSRCRDRSPIYKGTGNRPARRTDAHDGWTRHAVNWRRPAPHVISFAGSEASCVE
jgi:hypothetical protein